LLNIVIPMAGAGSRFSKVGYVLPKPLIDVNGTPMIEVVINNIKPHQDHRFIFICQHEHVLKYKLDDFLKKLQPDSFILTVDRLTEGPACTVLLAKKYINNDDQLMIANCDQYVNVDINAYLSFFNESAYDGLIMTMKSSEEKWSYIRYHDALVNSVVEKKVVSDEATVGIYNYKRGADFVRASEAMIAAEDRTNNEFYVAPAYNYLIQANQQIGFFNIGLASTGMYGLGVPEDLEFFCQDPISNFLKK
jgi:NDP-sugar pyrophosphorylase family protein